ncbi:uncharacterized protein EV422DRAFT_326243 [Fimicolochytrium jonesii]|uniref:uncharacterized protein n=1 Tax=Fimicolochytrium jonesii TaxID=1396493 RepID=UPI0022FDC22D|nr:uncharacterized protein EV422DRAFT_326243 [Fimicolochytrium jonesii]KAI8824585.1 hypothetical protein EV422DRAFT_326243 [Fimicolochytrium jonesii]
MGPGETTGSEPVCIRLQEPTLADFLESPVRKSNQVSRLTPLKPLNGQLSNSNKRNIGAKEWAQGKAPPAAAYPHPSTSPAPSTPLPTTPAAPLQPALPPPILLETATVLLHQPHLLATLQVGQALQHLFPARRPTPRRFNPTCTQRTTTPPTMRHAGAVECLSRSGCLPSASSFRSSGCAGCVVCLVGIRTNAFGQRRFCFR